VLYAAGNGVDGDSSTAARASAKEGWKYSGQEGWRYYIDLLRPEEFSRIRVRFAEDSYPPGYIWRAKNEYPPPYVVRAKTEDGTWQQLPFWRPSGNTGFELRFDKIRARFVEIVLIREDNIGIAEVEIYKE
jgi:hypothetical protein